MEVARLTAVIDANTSGFTRAMRGVNGNLDRTARNMGGIDAAAVGTQKRFSRLGGGVGRAMAIGTAAVAGFGVAAGVAAGVGVYKSIQAASDLSETVSKSKVVFGKASDDILKWSKTSAKQFGTSQRAALDAASGYAIFAKGAGMSDKESAKFSKTLVGLSADLASFYNTSTDDAATAIQAALRGETEPIRRYGVMLDDATMRQKALEMGITKTTKEALTPQQKVLAAQALIMEKTAVAQGDFERTSSGMANQQRILSATMEDAKAKIGEAFLPFVNMILPKIVAAIPPIVTSITRFTDALSKMGQRFLSNGDQMGQFQNKATTLFNQLRGYAIPIMAAFSRIIDTVGGMAQKVGPALISFLGTAMQTIGKIAAVALPIIADGIEKIGPPLARIATQMLKFGTVVFRVLGVVIPPVLRALKPVFETVFSGIASILSAIASLMEGDFSGAFRHGVNAVKTIMFAMPMFMADALIQVGSVVVSKAAEVGASIVRGIADGISSLPGLVKEKLTGMMDDALSAVKSKAKIFSPSRVWADEVGKPLGQGIILGFLNGSANLPSNVSDTVAKAMERAKSAVDRQKGAISAVFGRFAQGIMRAFDAETTAGVRRIQDRLIAAQTEVGVNIDARIATRRAQGAALTPAEAELQRERDAYDAKERERDKADALAALAAAEAENDARAIADARKRLDDIAYAERIRALENQAATERALRDAATEEDIAALETERTDRLAALQRQYDDEQLQYESAREVMRQKREDELARLEEFLTNSTGKVKEKTRALQAFLNRPDIKKAMAESGTNLGIAFANALGNTRGKVTAAVRTLAKIVQDYLRLKSPSKLGPLSTLDSWWAAMPDTLLKGVDTSMIGHVAAGIAAPDSGSGFGSGRGVGAAPLVVNVTVQGSVTSERDLVDTIRAELIKTGQRNGSIFGGYA